MRIRYRATELNADMLDNQLDDVTFDAGVEAEFLALKSEAGLIEDKTSSGDTASGGTSAESADDEFEKLKAELKG